MKTCPYCQSSLSDDAKFCNNCGASVSIEVPKDPAISNIPDNSESSITSTNSSVKSKPTKHRSIFVSILLGIWKVIYWIFLGIFKAIRFVVMIMIYQIIIESIISIISGGNRRK